MRGDGHVQRRRLIGQVGDRRQPEVRRRERRELDGVPADDQSSFSTTAITVSLALELRRVRRRRGPFVLTWAWSVAPVAFTSVADCVTIADADESSGRATAGPATRRASAASDPTAERSAV
jgi:hypothetical protein